MDADSYKQFKLDPRDVKIQYCRSGGNGGQKVNKTASCVILTHLPTGTQVRSEETRYQDKNEAAGWLRLQEKLDDVQRGKYDKDRKDTRSEQIGTGERSDKRRTYRERDNLVIDHVTNRSCQLKMVTRGNLDDLHRA